MSNSCTILRSYMFNIFIVIKHPLFFLIEEDRINVQFLRYFRWLALGATDVHFRTLNLTNQVPILTV